MKRFQEITRGIIVPFELRLKHKDGSLSWVRTSTWPVTDETGINGFFGILTDISKEKQAKESLRESEESYRGLFNTVRQAIYILDNELKFVDVNEGAEAMYGYPGEAFKGRSPEFLSAPGKNDLVVVMEHLRNAFSGEPQQFEFWGLRKNSEVFPTDVRLYKGTYFGQDVVIAIGTDITERKRAEEFLRESEIKLHLALSASETGMWELDIPSMRCVIDDRAAQILGYNLKDIGPHIVDWDALSHIEDIPLIQKRRADCVERRTAFLETEHRMRHASGKWMWVVVKGKITHQHPDGSPLRITGTVQNITGRKRVEVALQRSEEQYRLLIENSHDIIYTFSPQGIFTFASPSWTTLLGYPVTEVVGKPFQVFVHPDDIPGCLVFLQGLSDSGKPQVGVEYHVKHADGTWRWHTTNAVPLKDETGRILGFEGIASNITGRRQAKEALRLATRN